MNLISGDLLPSEIGMYPGDRTAWCQRDWAIHQDWALQSTSMNGAGVSFHQRKILAHPLCQNWSAKPIEILRVDLTRKKDETAGLGLAQQDRYTEKFSWSFHPFHQFSGIWSLVICHAHLLKNTEGRKDSVFQLKLMQVCGSLLLLIEAQPRPATTRRSRILLGPVPWSVALTDAVASPPLAGGRTSIPWLWLAL